MKKQPFGILKFIPLVILLMVGNHLSAQCGNPIINGTFSTHDYTGWVPAHGADTLNNGIEVVSGRLSLQIDEHQWPSNTLASIYQQLRVPVQGGELSFWYDSFFDQGTGAIQYSYAQVLLTDTNNAPLATIFYTQTSHNPDTAVYFDMTPFAGRTVRLYFQAQLLFSITTSGASCSFYADNINISAESRQTFNHCTLPIHDVVGGRVHTQPGVYRDTVFGGSAYGCDSVITSTITYAPVTYSQTITPYCPGTSISFTAGGHTHTAAGTYRDTIFGGSVNHCDSIITTTLSYYQPSIGYQYYNFCGSGSVTVLGHTYSPATTTTYMDTMPGGDMHGCDSIFVTHISVNSIPPSPAPVSSFTVNDGDSINAINFSVADDSLYAQWYGSTGSAGVNFRGARTLPAFKAVNNTNEPVIDTITVSARFRGYAYVAADKFIFKFSLVQHRFVDTIPLPSGHSGAVQVLKAPNSDVAYIFSYSAAPGTNNTTKCIYVLDLATDQIIRTINYTYPFISSSQHSSTYAGTITISPDGNNLFIIGNTSFQFGIYVIKLNINTGATTILRPQGINDCSAHGICITPDGHYLYIPRYHDFPLKVDAVYMTEVSTPHLQVSDAIGATYMAVNPNGQTLYIGNRYNQLLVASTANDSVIATINNLAISPSDVVQAMSFTPDSNYLFLMTADVSSRNLYTRKIDLTNNTAVPINNASGDAFDYYSSTIFPNVSVTPDGREYYIHYTDPVFFKGLSLAGGVNGNYGGVPFLGQGTGFGSVGNMMIPGQCASSEISFTITVNPTMRYTQSITLCPGENITIAGHMHNTTGTFVDTLVNASIYSTDSIVTTQLTILSSPVSYQAISLCGGNLTVGNKTHSATGYYTDTLHAASVNGCDSIVNTNLIINATVVAPSITVNNQTVCSGDNVTATPISVPSGGYHFTWTGSNAGIGLGVNGFDTVPAFTSVNNGNTPVTDTISINKTFTGYAYVGSTSLQRVSVIDRQTNNVVANINGIQGTTGLAVNPDGSRVYVTSQGQDKITVINGSTNTVITTINVGDQPAAVAVNNAGNRVYVANYAAGTVSVIDTVTNTVIATVPVGTSPIGVAVNPNGKYVYVVNSGSNTLSVISTLSNTVVATLNVGSNPQGVTVNATGTRIYVTNYITTGTVKVIDALSYTLTDSITVGNEPRGIAVSFDGSRAYVSNFLDNTVSVINTATNTVVATITVGSRPLAVSVSEDGSKLYVVNSNTSTISVIATANNTVSTNITVPVNNLTIGNFISGSGCQSTPVNYTITVNPTARYTQQISLCTGSSISVGNHTYNTAGVYIDTLRNASIGGCDSMVTTQLTMHNAVTSTITTTICGGNNYAGHTTTGTYVDHYNNIYGCDSARTLNLTVNQPVTSTITTSICGGSNYGGHTTTGTFVDHFTGANGCDSARTLNLTVNQPVTSTVTTSICDGSNYAGHSTTGSFIDHYTGANGCDSVRTLNLTVNPNLTSTVTTSICAGSSYAGHTITGTFVDHYTSITGCDSTRTLNLTVNSSITTTVTAAICTGSSYAGHTATGTFVDHFTAAGGCDSARTLNLVVNVPTSSSNNITICSSDLPYSWNGLTFTGAGSQTVTGLINSAGCDSSATLNLTVNAVSNSTTNFSICNSQLPYIWNGLTFTAAGSQTATGFTNAAGCDSSATLNLAVNQPSNSTTNYTICNAALPYQWNGLTFTGAGSQTATGFTNAAGCDSTATLNLTVNQVSNSTTDMGICAADLPYTWNGLVFTTAGSQTKTGLTTTLGCDSSATLNLTVNQPTSSTQSITVCASELPYVWNGLTFNAAGTQTATGFNNAAGCDSSATLTLSVNTIDSTITVSGATLTANQTGATYQWFDCNTRQIIAGANAASYTATITGDYSVAILKNNCTDTSTCVHVVVSGLPTIATDKMDIYPNPNDGVFTVTYNNIDITSVSIENTLGQVVAGFNISAPHTTLIDIKNLAAGVYVANVWSGNRRLATQLLVKQ